MSSDSACAVCSALCVGRGRFQRSAKRYASFRSKLEPRLPVPEFYKRALHEDRLSFARSICKRAVIILCLLQSFKNPSSVLSLPPEHFSSFQSSTLSVISELAG